MVSQCQRRARTRSLLAALATLLLLIAGLACGSGKSSNSGSSSGNVSITISPTSATLPVGTSQQFTATVSNASNTSVTWQVNGTTGGSATYGTISSTGTYTAPSSVPPSAVTVTAIAVADTSKTASASVTVTNANKLVISPAQATLPAGGQQTFSVTLGTQNADAVWSISCQNSVSGACGTISSTGVYTAPLSPPPGQLVSVTASSRNNTANPAFAPVTVTFGNGTLQGQYSFAMTGVKAGQPFNAAGSIAFDGKGNITGGIQDQGAATSVTITGGTYSVDAQGRVSATVHTGQGDESWQITLVNRSRALVMRTEATVIAGGELDLQNSAQFGQQLDGTFNFRLAKRTGSAVPASAMVGSLVFDGQGNITSGVLDRNDGGTVSPNLAVSGSSTPSDANGRGTITLTSSLGTQTFAYYLVNSTSAKLVETGGSPGLNGTLAARSGSPATPSQFSGSYAFLFTGANSAGEVGQGGTFTVDLNGGIGNAIFDVATDSNFQLGLGFSGSLDVKDSATGRTIATFDVGGSTRQYVVYPPSLNHEIVFLEIDGTAVTTGFALRQSNLGATAPSISGQFALSAGETSSVVRRTIAATLQPASITTGTLDTNDNGALTLGSTLQNSSFSVTSLYGRGRLQLEADNQKSSYTTYIVDSNTVLLLQTDGKGVVSGAMQKQY
jgi:hypothetical protein